MSHERGQGLTSVDGEVESLVLGSSEDWDGSHGRHGQVPRSVALVRSVAWSRDAHRGRVDPPRSATEIPSAGTLTSRGVARVEVEVAEVEDLRCLSRGSGGDFGEGLSRVEVEGRVVGRDGGDGAEVLDGELCTYQFSSVRAA